MAECHPVGFRWVMKAKERGATIIHVDPRFTRTSAVADIHVPIRAGSDIAFLGGIIHYILEDDRYFRDYVVNYTNASAILSEDFQDTEDHDGLFSGWDSEKGEYSAKKWSYKGVDLHSVGKAREPDSASDKEKQHTPRAEQTDPTLQHPRCVFQVLKRHFSRYTPEMVERTCGVSPEQSEACGRSALPQFGPRTDLGVLLRRRLDPAHHRRAIYPHCVYHPIAARQHWTSGRRHPGAARPRVHSRLHRYPHAL